ncbi:MAG: hypothetical protein KBS51_05410 [Lachnospiraceae bacterium]|nr:hypothetical protein [Candidatus Darwinimomas equi]
MKAATGYMSTYRNKKQKNIIADIIAIVLLLIWTFLINRKIRISGLYMDDLYLWSCFKDESLMEYVLPEVCARFRPVYWLASWIELYVIGNRIWLIVPINLIITAVTAVVCYFFISDISESRLIAFFSSFAIITSRFAYYDVSQLLGLLESMSMFFAIVICIELFKYMHDGKSIRFYIALIFYFLVSFTHERYIVLIPIFFYVLITIKDKSIIKYVLSAVTFVLILAIRLHYIGTLLPAGTGGTEVAETFTVQGFIESAVSEIKYLVGINAGPEYLSGIPWESVDYKIRTLVFVGLGILAIILICFIAAMIRHKKEGKSAGPAIRDFVFFTAFIIGLVTASSVTIRVEMRWLYSSFVMLIFLVAYMYGYIRSGTKKQPVILMALIIALMLLFSVEDIYYRQSWGNIYLFQNQERYNSLSDNTWGRYREGIFDRDIYIIGNSYEMSDFTADTFFKTFDKDGKSENMRVIHVESQDEIPQDAWGKDIILQEDPANNGFMEIGIQ